MKKVLLIVILLFISLAAKEVKITKLQHSVIYHNVSINVNKIITTKKINDIEYNCVKNGFLGTTLEDEKYMICINKISDKRFILLKGIYYDDDTNIDFIKSNVRFYNNYFLSNNLRLYNFNLKSEKFMLDKTK